MKLFKATVYTLLSIVFFYYVVLNVALYLPVTQTLINKMKPEKFHISWDRAWTIYPFKLNVENLSANGETSSQLWQVDAKSITASIKLLPLLNHKVNVYDALAYDVKYLQSAKKKPDKDYSRIAKYFPDIEGREAGQSVLAKEKSSHKSEKKKKAWK
ncbi:MAG: hypothetical protein KAH25_12485, partial [Bacteroidales bacterium]|nr:hypothetical protein [Bacteroidales bacterium]